MVGVPPSVPVPAVRDASAVPAAAPGVPVPRRPVEAAGAWERVRWWYESALGWPTAPGVPVRLRTGVRFDVLDVPAKAGHAALERLGRRGTGPRRPGFPVALRGERMLLLVAAGGADELPGLLEWLEWGSLPVDLTAVGAGGLVEAPLGSVAGVIGQCCPGGQGGADGLLDRVPPAPASGSALPPPRPPDRDGRLRRGAAVWLRPPEQGCEVEASLPTLSAVGGVGSAPDLARLVHTLATECHRVRLSPPRALGL
ncbi:SCO3374 family protein [Streptomyces sp. NPDC058794]|uniref:SCO3374 family protein n=1 Tax=unclassified Streptomyces TaxID=2593676 RepID=UPI00368FECBD